MLFKLSFPIHLRSRRKHRFSNILLLILLLINLSILSACSLVRQQVPTPQLEVKHVSADEIARAMQEDHFYSDYNPYALIVQGVVADVRHENNDYILELGTQIQTKVLCDFGSQAPNARAGDSIEILTPRAHEAQRQPNAVLLTHCSIP